MSKIYLYELLGQDRMNVNLSNPNLTWNSEKDVPIELLGQDRMNVNLSKP